MKNQGGLLKKAGKVIIIPVLICAGFFCIQKSLADSSDIVINEIAWMGTETSSSDEWIELRNLTGSEISLEGWTLVAQDSTPTINLFGSIPANGYFLLERADDDSVPNITADLIYGTNYYKWALNNSGEVLELRDGDGNLIDSIDASAGWPSGDNDTKQTMERDSSGSRQTSESAGGTPGAQNSSGLGEQPPAAVCGDGNIDTGEVCDDGNTVDGDGCSVACTVEQAEDGDDEGDGEDEDNPQEEGDGIATSPQATPEVPRNDTWKLGDVVINEFVSDPTDGEVEWIELYNTTGKEINLEDWTVEEGSEAKTNLEGIIGPSGEDKFFVIAKPKGNLNNKGDIIILRNSVGALIDQVAYGNWDDGDINNNAPAAADPNSIARKFDGQNSYNNLNDFGVSATPTKNKSNIITIESEEAEEELSAEEKANYDYSDNIIISEIFPNPEGSDSENEFIELYNKGERNVDLTGWLLGDESKKRYRFKAVGNSNDEIVFPAPREGRSRNDSIIKVGEYFVIYRDENKIALNNSSDSVKLFQPLKDKPLQTVKYEKAIEGWSYNNAECVGEISNIASSTGNDNLGTWRWSEIITPGEENNIITINHSPVVEFYCLEKIIVGQPVLFDSSDTIDEDGDELEFSWDFGDGIKLNLPCPEHTYLAPGDYVVKLIVSDKENEAEKEKIIKVVSDGTATSLLAVAPRNDSVVINEVLPNPEGTDSEGEWVEIKNTGETKINLLNWKLDDSEGGSKPFLFDSDLWLEAGSFYAIDRVDSGLALNNSVDAVRLFDNFDELVDEIEYEKVIEGEAYARGQNNKLFWTTVLTPGQENIITVSDSQTVANNAAQVSGVDNKSTANTKSEKIIIETTLEKIKEFESGELVKVKGVVAVRPGVLGTQYFYIVGSPGIQIYNYKKDFPNLEVGDYIEVSGELSVVSGEQRIKTKIATDMKILERRTAPDAQELSCDKITDESIGQLVSVTGEVVERKSSIVYLDDGTDEVIVYIKTSTGINPKSIKEGDIISVTGIVSCTKSGPRVMPRSNDDIIKKDIESSDSVGQVLGEVAASDEWEIAKRDKKLELFKYLLVLAGAIVVTLAGLLIKQFRK